MLWASPRPNSFALGFSDTAAKPSPSGISQPNLLSGTVALMIPGRVSARRFVASQISSAKKQAGLPDYLRQIKMFRK